MVRETVVIRTVDAAGDTVDNVKSNRLSHIKTRSPIDKKFANLRRIMVIIMAVKFFELTIQILNNYSSSTNGL